MKKNNVYYIVTRSGGLVTIASSRANAISNFTRDYDLNESWFSNMKEIKITPNMTFEIDNGE